MSSDPDFRSLLDTKVDDAKKPPTWPAGTYFGVITKYELGRQNNEKKTPFCNLFVSITEAGDDIAEQVQELGIDMSKRQFSSKQWMTEDSLYRFKDFMHSCGIDTAGRGFGETIPNLVGVSVLVELNQRPRRNQDGTVDMEDMVNEITNLKGKPE